MRFRFGLFVAFVVGALVSGCPPEDFARALPPSLEQIDEIRNDSVLTPNEKRVALEALGVPASTINALLRAERLGNQYGGDPRTAYVRVKAPHLTHLTPDEVQIYGDLASSVDDADELDVTLSDTEAQAIVTFLAANALDAPADLAAYLETPGNEVPSTIPEGVLELLFVDFDPDLLVPLLP